MRLKLAVLVLALAAPGAAEVLAKHDPFGVLGPKQKGFCAAEPASESAIRQLLAAGRISSICKMPGTGGDFLVVADIPAYNSAQDIGWRLLLVRRQGEGFRALWHSRGAQDSYVLKPVFYVGRERVLVLAEAAAEYFYGNLANEYANGAVRELGDLNVGREVPEADGVGTTVGNPLDKASVSYDGAYIVKFRSGNELFFDAGGPREARLRTDKDGSVTFRYNGRQFVQISPNAPAPRSDKR